MPFSFSPQSFTQKITFTNADRLSAPVPVNVGAATEPVRVAEFPVKLGVDAANVPAGTTPCVPVKVAAELVPVGVKLVVPLVGGLAGHAIVPAGVNAAVEFVPVAVVVWV
jgi:hypothetical protein